ERNRINSAILNLIDKAEMVSKDNINIKRSPILENLMGHCIRTGVQIPFNLERPLSYDAYLTWSQFSNGDYPEKYCHFSGEPSNGETSFNYPILKKNWQRAKEVHGF
ncbi:MAG TPA: hypothetical protein PK203_20670, partial [Cyclobacteriaceae bacterium]|nr:hypothetical protein [Cyclobacteriaceae bacterium]